MIATIISFFAGGWMRWALLAVIITAALAFEREHLINEGRTQVIAETKVAAAKIVVKQGEATVKIVDHYHETQGKTKTEIQYVDREVTKYAEQNTSYCLDAEWGKLHDSSAINAISNSSIGTDAARGAPTAATALEVVTENYARDHRTADRLDALQDWVRQQSLVK